MALIDNIGDVAFASRYPIDKIIARGVGSVSLPAAEFIDTPMTTSSAAAHGLGGNIIASGMYSIDGVNFYPLGSTVFGSVVSGQIEQASCNVACNDTDILIRASSAFLSEKSFTVNLFFESIA